MEKADYFPVLWLDAIFLTIGEEEFPFGVGARKKLGAEVAENYGENDNIADEDGDEGGEDERKGFSGDGWRHQGGGGGGGGGEVVRRGQESLGA